MLDESVAGERFGLRTYAEYPSDHFPAVSRHGVFAKDAKPWAKGTAYQANDVVKLAVNAVPGQLQAVCVAPHTASEQNQPLKGTGWKASWVVKVPAHVQFFADPLTAGAYDAAAGRAGNWADMDHFTLDFAFTQNAEPKVYPQARMLCGAVMGNAQGAGHRVWMLTMHPNGDLTFDLTLAANAVDAATPATPTPAATPPNPAKSIRLAQGCAAAGTYRLALQVDFPSHAVRAWLRKPADKDFARTCDDARTLPPGGHFKEMEYGYFVVAGGETSAAASNYETPPTDLTVCGLHTSAALRYADDEPLLRRGDGRPVDDNFRYFANDEGTLAFLPLTDHPAEADLRTAGLLVTVQHGGASGDARQRGYGYLKPPEQIYGIGRPRVSDLTIEPGPTWGAGVVTWHTLNLLLQDLDCRGGSYAVTDLFYGAQYPIDVRRCTLSGGEAAFAGSSNIVYMKDVTIDPVGRFGILLAGSNLQADHVTFRDPQTHQSQYYFRHVNTVDYGGMNLLGGVHADAPAGCRFPSRAAFSQEKIYYSRTAFVMRDSSVSNMGPEAVFLDLPVVDPPGARLLLDHCTYAGSPIAAWVRTESPYWAGRVSGFDPKAPVRKYLDYRPPAFAEWKAGTKYAKAARVEAAGESWECVQPHAAEPGNAPGGEGGRAYWAKAMPHVVFEP